MKVRVQAGLGFMATNHWVWPDAGSGDAEGGWRSRGGWSAEFMERLLDAGLACRHCHVWIKPEMREWRHTTKYLARSLTVETKGIGSYNPLPSFIYVF